MQGYNTSFTVQQGQLKGLRVAITSQEETDLIDQQIREMLNKGAILVAENLESQLLNSFFSVGKKSDQSPFSFLLKEMRLSVGIYVQD